MASEAFVYILAGNKADNGHIPIYIGSTTDLGPVHSNWSASQIMARWTKLWKTTSSLS